MHDLTKFYINGTWVDPTNKHNCAIFNPANEEQIANISLGTKADIDLAVNAARGAFLDFSNSSVEYRLHMLQLLLDIYNDRYEEMAKAISLEMGAPISFAKSSQAACGSGHIKAGITALKNFSFDKTMPSSQVFFEAIGVCALITPWNWPINQIACKVVPALATGCAMVLKPSELTPLSSHLFADMIAQAGYKNGVFNLVDGLGVEVGASLAGHADVDMVSFTGSTQAGVKVSQLAAQTIKRTSLELGGKSANIILEHDNFNKAVEDGIYSCFRNTGQSCNAPTRMLVPESKYEQTLQIASNYSQTIKIGDPSDDNTEIGPLVSKIHFDRVQEYINIGIQEGAKLICGGLGKPDGFAAGHYTRPTIFADVEQNMTIVREEIFGPVLCIQKFKDIEQAIQMANDSPFGLAAYISGEQTEAMAIAKRIRAGMISINGNSQGFDSPFGGYKQSGNGREWGEFGFDDYLEIKTIVR